jgi:hypothetical protein
MPSSTRPLWIALVAGLSVSGAMGANCNPQSVFACATDEDCLEQGEGGQCESGNVCSFPDETCPTGRRWHDRAPIDDAGMCWGLEGETESDGDDETTGDDATTGSASTSTSTTSTTSTGAPDDDAATSDADDTNGSSSGAAPSCDEQYGEAADYLLCDESPESCSFNVTIAMTISCDDVCSMFGGTCIEAHLNEEDLCESTGRASCDQSDFDDGICVCTRS